MLDYPEDANHITNKRKYDELIDRIRWEDGNGVGAKWSFEDKEEETKIYRGSYYNQKKYKQYGEQDYCDDYPTEDRRGVRKYRNEHMNDYDDRKYDDPFENRRRYDNPQNNGDFFRQK